MGASQSLLWVQGLNADRPEDKTLSWVFPVLRRLRGQYGAIETGTTTGAAEKTLALDSKSYFSLGSSSPDYGLHIITFRVTERLLSTGVTFTPFDSGGLAKGHIAGTARMSVAERVSLLERHTYDVESYASRLESWLSKEYGRVTEYILGDPPQNLLVDEFHKIEGQDPRAWFWEAQLPARDYAPHPLDVVHIYFKDGDQDAFLDYVQEEDLAGAAFDEIEKLVLRVGLETPAPHYALLEDLCEEAAA